MWQMLYFAHFARNRGLKLLGQSLEHVCLFLAFLSNSLSTNDSQQFPLFRSARVHHSIDLLSAWERARKRRHRRRRRRRFSCVNRDTPRERKRVVAPRSGTAGFSRSGEWNAYWISRKRGEGMSIAVQYLSSVAVAVADADRVGAGNGISSSRSRRRCHACGYTFVNFECRDSE